MKRIIKLICFLTVILIFVTYTTNCYQNKSNIPKKEDINPNYMPIDIPTEYKGYKNLDNITSNLEFNIRTFKSNFEEYAFRINDSLICMKTNSIDDINPNIINRTFYKIDKLGNITDSLTFKNQKVNQENKYLLNITEDFYLSWLTDGDKKEKPIELINSGKVHNEDETKQHTKDADFIKYQYVKDSISDKRLMKIVFLKQNRWHKIISTDDFHIINDSGINYSLYFEYMDKMLTLDYFHKEKFNPKSSGHFNPTGPRSEYWRGTAYLTLNRFKNLKFKKEWVKMYSNDNKVEGLYKIFEDSLRNFIIIKERMIGQGGKQYLIQNKK